SWNTPDFDPTKPNTGFGILNDDNAQKDGFSEGNYGFNGRASGRPKFQPELAVDPVTGTVVASWYDARWDAARRRVARYVTASIHGGRTFGGQTYLNDLAPYINGVPQFDTGLAFDVVTRRLVPIGPVPDNMSTGNIIPNRDTTFAFGDHQSLAVMGGKIF